MTADTEVGLYEGLCTTRAIRRYLPEDVSEEDLAKILFAATRAPSGSNRQIARFLVLRRIPEARAPREVLGRGFRESWSAKRGRDRYDEGSGTEADSPKARQARTVQRYVDAFEDVPVVVLVCAGVRSGELGFLDGGSVYPACQNLLLAARALGYGGVMSVWHMAVHDELRESLGIPPDVVIAATITLGRPEGRHGPVRRRPLGEAVYDGGWGQTAAWAMDPEGTRFSGRGAPPLYRPPVEAGQSVEAATARRQP